MNDGPNKKLMNLDFSALTANELWDVFESKASNGGSLAYAVLSRARKLGCPCSISLDKLKELRLKQKKIGLSGLPNSAMQLGLKGMHMRSPLRVLLTSNDSPHVGLLLHLFF